MGQRLEALKAIRARALTRKVVFDACQPRVDEADNFNASLICETALRTIASYIPFTLVLLLAMTF